MTLLLSLNSDKFSRTWVDVGFDGSAATNAALRALAAPPDAAVFNVQGYYAAGDGGGGLFFWNATDARADDGGTIIAANGVATGRWNRIYDGVLNVRWFGAKGDALNDDTSAIQAAINVAASVKLGLFSGAAVFMPTGMYRMNGTGLTMAGGVRLFGAGKENTILRHKGTGPAITVPAGTSDSVTEQFTIEVLSNDPTAAGILMLDSCYSNFIRSMYIRASQTVAGQYGFKLLAAANGSYWNIVGDCTIKSFPICVILDTDQTQFTGSQANANMFSNLRIYSFSNTGIQVVHGNDNTFMGIQLDLFNNATGVAIQNSSTRNIMVLKAEGGTGSSALSFAAASVGNMVVLDDECPNGPTFLGTSNLLLYNGEFLADQIDQAVAANGLKIGAASSKIGLWGAAPVVQQGASGITAGYTAGASTAVTIDGQFTGNVGTTKYTLGDVIAALKNEGSLKM